MRGDNGHFEADEKKQDDLAEVTAFSLIIGLFLFSVSTLANAAKIHVSSMMKWLLIQTAFHLLQFIVAGLLIGLVARQTRTAGKLETD